MFHIAVSEDDKNIRRLFSDVLKSDGYKVYEANGGEELLELLEDTTYRFTYYRCDDASP